jgi:DNA-binding transcriptional LysR family regulator
MRALAGAAVALGSNRELGSSSQYVIEGIDVAVVITGAELDSGLIRRKLSAGDRWCCASPAYLSQAGVPREPVELRTHDCIVDGAAGWELIP